MQRIKITHTTTYQYPEPVRFLGHKLHVRPREGHDIRIEASELHITPAYRIHWQRDVYGNSVAIVDFSESADKLEIVSIVVVEHYQSNIATVELADGVRQFPFAYDPMEQTDLVPYQTLTTEAPVAVMMGHLEVPGLTGDTPASLSSAAVGLLRSGGYGGPGFNGPVFSDDLSSMAAISSRYGVAEAVLRTLQAGTDVALWITTAEVPAVLDRLEAAVNGGELAMPAVEGSIMRMAKGPSARCGG